METGLADKVVVVTGATVNIGRGIALAFAEEGARVVVVGRDEVAGERVAAEALERGARGALWRPADVTVGAEVTALVADVVAELGGVDVLVNNVGGNVDVTPFASSTPDQWRADLDINLMSTFHCTHAVIPHLVERGGGRIINVGSMSGLIGDRNMAVYSAAKGGVHAFTRVLAMELGTSGITVNAIAPYFTRSDDLESDMSSGSRAHPQRGVLALARAADPDMFRTMLRETVLDRQRGRPAEIGAAAVYLASDNAAFVTGQVLQVDGGVMLA